MSLDCLLSGCCNIRPSKFPRMLLPYHPSILRWRYLNIGTSAVLTKVSPVFPSFPQCGTPCFFASSFIAEISLPIDGVKSVSYTHLRAHETRHDLVCRLLLE